MIGKAKTQTVPGLIGHKVLLHECPARAKSLSVVISTAMSLKIYWLENTHKAFIAYSTGAKASMRSTRMLCSLSYIGGFL